MSKDAPTLKAGRPSLTRNNTAFLASLDSTGGFKRVNINLTHSDHTKLKIYATRRGQTITQVLTEFVKGLQE